MRSFNYILICGLLLVAHIPLLSYSQVEKIIHIKGKVENEDKQPIMGALISAQHPHSSTYTLEDGTYEIDLHDHEQIITIESPEISKTEFTIQPSKFDGVFIVNKSVIVLDGVTVKKRRKSTTVSMIQPIKTEKIGMKELAKAACCNLSESFETTPSVDAGFTDAVSGYKQISMLGLSGPNVAFTRENIPDIRGLASITGLTFTPGPWVESIQLSKGTGSVVNGFEGVAGQINVEYIKPTGDHGIKLLLNGYQSAQGRSELNFVSNHFLSENTNTTIFGHYKNNWLKVDQNNDGYLDQPLGSTYILGNRWMLLNGNGWEVQIGLKGTYMDIWSGAKNYQKGQLNNESLPWGFENQTQRGEIWAKIGKIFPDYPDRSMGLQISGTIHEQDAQYGLRNYQGKQNSIYANYIFQTAIFNPNNTLKVGASLQYDHYNETFQLTPFNRKEIVPGLFTEYAYNWNEKLNLVLGIRADHNNFYGAFVTPRLHIRYAPQESLVFRGSIGKAQRTVNVISENIGYLVSNREFVIPYLQSNQPYGLDAEVAWNMGINATKKFILNYRDGSISIDYYYTHFENMVVTDIENYQNVRFYNLKNQSYAHSFQAQLDYELIRNFDIRIAYRMYNVQTNYKDNSWAQKPLIAKNRFFINLAYETSNQWNFDVTTIWTGSKRMPAHLLEDQTTINPSYLTPSYWLWNLQISKAWNEEQWKVYIGVENIFNVMQKQLIINKDNPYDNGFDGSLIWGSAMGRNIYLGINYRIHQ